MRHQTKVSHFGRRTGPRRALIRGLVTNLIEHGRIRTTLAKAKELRRHADRAVTMAKKNSLHARRLLLARYPNPAMIDRLMTEVGPQMANRNGGYTRVLKLGTRPGDKAEMALIEWVGIEAKTEKKAAKGAAGETAEGAPAKKTNSAKKAAPKKAAKKAK